MTTLTLGQCARLSLLSSANEKNGLVVEWREVKKSRHELQYRVTSKYVACRWETLLSSRSRETFDHRVKVADTYYKAAASIQDVLKKAQS